MSFSLKLLGGLTLADGTGPLTGPAVQRHRLALLALLAASHPRPLSRDKVMAWLWPERDTEPARRLLNQAVHALRQALGAEAIRSAGEELQLDTGPVGCDVVAFEEALAGGEPARAAALYAGPFLDGFFLSDAPEFERWVDRERDRLAAAYAKALEGLAEAAEREEDGAAAADWWKARAAHDPYDSRVALRYMQALERTGNRAGALQHAALHQQRLHEELEIGPPPEIRALAERLRRGPAPTGAAPARKEPADRGATPPAPVLPEPPPALSRSALWYAAAAVLLAAVLLAAATGGVMRLSSGGGRTEVAASPAVVDRIAQAVAREMDRRQRGDTAVRLPSHRTRSIPAYEFYLRGDDPALLRSDSGARLGLEYFRRAVALDSGYAAAWTGLARMTFRLAADGPDSMAAARAAAEMAVGKALALDDSLAEAHALYGVMRAMASDFAEGERHLRHALDLEPARTRVREWFANFLLYTGRPAEALAEAERALALDSLSPSAAAEVARALAANGRCDEALARLQTIAALDPPLLRAAPIATQCYARQGRWAEAAAALRPQAERGDNLSLAMLGYVSGRGGERAQALSIQGRLLDRWRSGGIGAYYLAFVPAGLGDRDQAFGWLDRAYDDGSLRFSPARGMGVTAPPFDDLQQDPRMDRLRARLGIQKR